MCGVPGAPSAGCATGASSPRAGSQEFLVREIDGVAAHAAGRAGSGQQVSRERRCQAMGGQARNGEIVAQRIQPPNAILGGCIPLPGEQPRHDVEAGKERAFPPRERSAARLARITAGSSAAHKAPCGASRRPPRGPARPCTAPRPALARARPPNRLASDMCSRAARFAPSWNATRSQAETSAMPSRHIASVIGVARRERYGLDELCEGVEAGRRRERRAAGPASAPGRRVRRAGASTRAGGWPSRRARATPGRRSSSPPRRCPPSSGPQSMGADGHAQRSPVADDFEVVQRVAAIRQQRRHRLARVDDAAATDGNNRVAGRRRRGAVAARTSRVSAPPVTMTRAATRPVGIERSTAAPRPHPRAAGNEQRATAELRAQGPGNCEAASRAKHDPPGGAETRRP